jgi:hypothetical protein
VSEHSLPDDLSRWPDDPYELLGVRRGVAPRDLKRSYTRLIRIYKPEHYPEHFRRIRAAYEQILRYVELFEKPGDGPDGAEQQAPSQPPDEDALGQGPFDQVPAPDRSGAPVDRPSPPAPPSVGEMDILWQRAIGGDESAAYGGLTALAEREPQRIGLYLRLYWLLAVDPELDATRSPIDWLVRGIGATGRTGPLGELYRRELELRPEQALAEPCGRLLQQVTTPAELASLLSWRWRAAGRLARWGLVAAERERMRDRICPDDEERWLQLLLTIADGAAWAEDDEGQALFASCAQEVGRHEHAAVRHPDWFDRLDYLRSVRSGWRALRDAGYSEEHFPRLIAAGWARPTAELRPLLLEVCSQIQDEPHEWLGYFDQVERLGAAVLGFFCDLMRQLDLRLEVQQHFFPSPEQVAQLAWRFVEESAELEYGRLRHRMLDFCLAESVQPEWLAQALLDLHLGTLPPGQTLGQVVMSDWPLRCVCLAVWLFWLS